MGYVPRHGGEMVIWNCTGRRLGRMNWDREIMYTKIVLTLLPQVMLSNDIVYIYSEAAVFTILFSQDLFLRTIMAAITSVFDI